MFGHPDGKPKKAYGAYEDNEDPEKIVFKAEPQIAADFRLTEVSRLYNPAVDDTFAFKSKSYILAVFGRNPLMMYFIVSQILQRYGI